jgi:hypothetical protein
MHNAKPLLNQNGIVITMTHLAVSGKSFTWRSLGFVKVVRIGGILTKLLGRPPTFHLMISTKADPNLVSVFNSKDAGLMKRVEEAINRVAKCLGVERASRST